MAEVRNYRNIGILEVPFLTAASTGYAKITTSHIGLLASLSADETAGIAAAATAYRPILGQITNVEDDDNITVNAQGFMEVACGETVSVASNTGYLGVASGYLYSLTASYALAQGDQPNYTNALLIKGGTTAVKAIIKLA